MDTAVHAIRLVDTDGIVTTIAGNTTGIPTDGLSIGQQGLQNGPGSTARFYRPYYCAADDRGNIYVADAFNALIRYLEYSGDPWIGKRFGPKYVVPPPPVPSVYVEKPPMTYKLPDGYGVASSLPAEYLTRISPLPSPSLAIYLKPSAHVSPLATGLGNSGATSVPPLPSYTVSSAISAQLGLDILIVMLCFLF
jgi:hypothetical protein